MNPWLILFSLPTVVQSIVIFFLVAPIFCSYRGMRVVDGLFILQWRPWFGSRWRYTTTLGVIMGTHLPYEMPTRLLEHEKVHARQYEDMNLLGAVIGGLICILDWRWGVAVWASSGMLWLLPNFLSGWIRYGNAYRGSEHERSAYAQTRY